MLILATSPSIQPSLNTQPSQFADSDSKQIFQSQLVSKNKLLVLNNLILAIKEFKSVTLSLPLIKRVNQAWLKEGLLMCQFHHVQAELSKLLQRILSSRNCLSSYRVDLFLFILLLLLVTKTIIVENAIRKNFFCVPFGAQLQ